MLDHLRARLRAVVLRRRLEREMQEEMAEHLRRSTERLAARGLPPHEARRQAVREFGNVAWLQEQARDARGARWLEALAADARFALRHFARSPLTTLTMFGVLAVGICVSTLLFAFVHSYAVQPPPGIGREADLVRIRGSRSAGGEGSGYRTFGEEEVLGYRRLGGQFRAVAAWSIATVPLVSTADAERRNLEARATFVTGNYFPVLGVRTILGPGLPTAEEIDPAAAAVAVIGHGTWDQLFGRRPDVVGSTIVVNGVPVTVVGVAPERFGGVGLGHSRLHVWMPLAARDLLLPGASWDFRAAARLHPGVTLDAATAAVRVVVDRAAAGDEELRALRPSTDVVPLLSANSDPMFERDVRLMTALVGLLALLVLLVACTNVSALLTGLAAARRQEIAVRLSLGAARGRIVRQLLTESALLAVAAGAAALALVWVALRAATRLIPAMPFEIAVTAPATAFTFGVALAVGVLFGLSPALHATRLGLASAMREAGGGIAGSRGRLQRGLVVAQVAFTQPLIVLLAAVLLLVLGEFQPPRRAEHPERLVELSLRPAAAATQSPLAAASQAQLRGTMRRLLERARETPGVESAVIDWGGGAPLGAYVVHGDDRVDGASPEQVRLSGARAAEGYFAMMGVRLVRGREFAPEDLGAATSRTGDVAVVIGAELARRMWAGADPLGRRLRATDDSAGLRTLVVVGVVDDPLDGGRRYANEDHRVYLPPDTSRAARTLLLRTAGPAQPLVPALRELVRAEAPDMVSSVRTLAEMQAELQHNLRLVAGGISAAGLMALLLSAIGLYAVVAFAVGQRTREIAVRMAVGARGEQIARRFVGDGVRLSAVGLLLGLPAALAGLHVLMSADADFPPVPFGRLTAIAATGVVVVAAAAAWIPARRAAAVDPAETLRAQ